MTRHHNSRWVFEASSDTEAIAIAVRAGDAGPSAIVTSGTRDHHPPVYSLVGDGTGKLTPHAVNEEARVRGGERPFTPGID